MEPHLTPSIRPSPPRRAPARERRLPANLMLEALPAESSERLRRLCRRVRFEAGRMLCEAGLSMDCVYFPLGAVISQGITLRGHRPLDLGLIGSEGMLGATAALGVAAAPLRAVVQGAGTALELRIGFLQRELQANAQVRAVLHRYVYSLMGQQAQLAACSRFHPVQERLARFLLLAHDRAHSDRLHMTHQFLADMLGVRRSAVTVAAGVLRDRQLIRYTRGELVVITHAGLEQESCECYGALHAMDLAAPGLTGRARVRRANGAAMPATALS